MYRKPRLALNDPWAYHCTSYSLLHPLPPLSVASTLFASPSHVHFSPPSSPAPFCRLYSVCFSLSCPLLSSLLSRPFLSPLLCLLLPLMSTSLLPSLPPLSVASTLFASPSHVHFSPPSSPALFCRLYSVCFSLSCPLLSSLLCRPFLSSLLCLLLPLMSTSLLHPLPPLSVASTLFASPSHVHFSPSLLSRPFLSPLLCLLLPLMSTSLLPPLPPLSVASTLFASPSHVHFSPPFSPAPFCRLYSVCFSLSCPLLSSLLSRPFLSPLLCLLLPLMSTSLLHPLPPLSVASTLFASPSHVHFSPPSSPAPFCRLYSVCFSLSCPLLSSLLSRPFLSPLLCLLLPLMSTSLLPPLPPLSVASTLFASPSHVHFSPPSSPAPFCRLYSVCFSLSCPLLSSLLCRPFSVVSTLFASPSHVHFSPPSSPAPFCRLYSVCFSLSCPLLSSILSRPFSVASTLFASPSHVHFSPPSSPPLSVASTLFASPSHVHFSPPSSPAPFCRLYSVCFSLSCPLLSSILSRPFLSPLLCLLLPLMSTSLLPPLPPLSVASTLFASPSHVHFSPPSSPPLSVVSTLFASRSHVYFSPPSYKSRKFSLYKVI
ncbi:hypothetical protein RRG08_039222 [Elysia crispata]|uniref:Uncharacterized protein n=1 Tax=Elysia crispata TaxID=231223 RepID=A0AAE1ASY6_9GAST|nr:hypothetical protein RRG08_039222 [Elysia crispata]